MRKILFVGHETCKNRGCEAIVRCTAKVISHHIPDARFRVICHPATIRYDSSIIHKCETPVAFSPRLFRRTRYLALSALRHRLGLSPRYEDGLYWQRNMHSYYSRADLVVAIGGDNFTESYGVNDAIAHLNDVRYAQYIGKPTVIWAASIGPFTSPELRELAIKVFSGAGLITVREKISKKYLKSLGIVNNVRLVADPAFLLKRSNTQRSLLKTDAISKPIVGIGVSALRSDSLGISQNAFKQIISSFIDHIAGFYNATVLLVPHVMYEGNDDYLACKALMEIVSRKDRVFLAGNYDMLADELKGVIAECDYFIGYRTHSTIAALSTFVPTIALAYSNKAFGIFEHVFGHGDYVVDGRSITVEKLLSIFDALVANRNDIVRLLAARIPVMQHLSMKGGAYLAAFLNKDRSQLQSLSNLS